MGGIMRIKLQNKHIVTLIPFLQSMKLRGERSRARSKFLEIAMKSYYSLHESEVELLKEYAVLDDLGELKQSENGFTLKEETAREYLIERDKLFSEVAEIEGGTYTSHLELMRQILADYDEELDGDNAALYDALWDAFESEMGVNTDG
jgi:hypothetical protein